MRILLSAAIGLTISAAACGGSSGGTTGSSGAASSSAGAGSATGAAATSSGTTGTVNAGTTGTTGGAGSTTGAPGTSTGAPATSTGGSAGLAAGSPCTSNAVCQTGICGTDGMGKCCTTTCSISDQACGATGCDDTGACTYPMASTQCGTASCNDGVLTSAATCNGSGSCATGSQTQCANNLGCQDDTTCATTCTTSADCATGFVCNASACVTAAAVGTCTENDDCTSGVCGLNGTGNCCTTACATTTDPACAAAACDVVSGACEYPSGTACGTNSCMSSQATTSTCDTTGACNPTTTACANNYGCNAAATACNATCAATADCASGFFCVTDAGACDAQIATGACTENDACTSDVCGIAGSGHCCTAACTNTTAPCGAADCDNATAACSYPASGTACGTVAESCSGSTQQNASACDGSGNCNTMPGTTDCTPYVCGVNACLATCSDNTSCGTGDFCDVANTACCSGLANSGAITVDSANGSDATACCGIGGNGACQTLNQAMKLIDSAQAQNVTITATVGGAGGDWAPANEVYPIVLGWGVELSAPGVFFTDANGDAEIFDITNYSSNDMVGYASIVGTGGSQVSIGMDSLGNQSTDLSAIEVEASNSLYIANASVNGSASNQSTAITVAAGGTLWLGEDQMAAVTGTVTIGNSAANAASDGYNGIVCGSTSTLGCSISDATLAAGTSSVVIEGQEGVDIDAEDNAVVTLSSTPVVGIAPSAVGFENCPSKPDSATAETEAVLLNGSATMTFSNGTIQCISGDGFVLQAADSLASLPTLTLSGTTIQNTEFALYATAGTATIANCTIEYNYNGVEQGTDGTNYASVDLSGGGVGTNTVVCCNSAESIFGVGGLNGVSAVCALNTTINSFDADDVNWDTNNNASPPPDEPDLFTCSDAALTTCTCEDSSSTCTNAGGVDGMDAVYTSSGTISQNSAGLSTANCTVPPG